MVLVDTSVWISLYRKESAEIGQKISVLAGDNRAALCGQIWVEYLGGFRREPERRRHEKALNLFPFLETSREAYRLAADLLALYPRLGAGDAVIAATALMNRCPIFTLDQDFLPLKVEGLKFY